ncbi:putative ankyrin repeat protein RF_0580 isoform X2 [Odontomachus brunneus]|uniref:putative ankyrin repeat protein RF_0580 isoform X2 n=1 Tax=Odontomachus brunneus TaxID=486640 RepID=UPI0013F1E524|nr:putative ankyrin repeat protein RF_0580 isoform X2 [Odontomachus brunneus]
MKKKTMTIFTFQMCSKKNINYNYRQLYDEKRIFENRVLDACKEGNLDMIQEYLKKYDINDLLHTGKPILSHAAENTQLDIIEYLLKHGADPNRPTNTSNTILMELCSSVEKSPDISLKCLQLLIEAKVDVNARTESYRETALMRACASQNIDFVTELLKHATNINAYDYNKRSALTYAVINNKVDVVELLWEHCADVTLLDKFNFTLKEIAKEYQSTQVSTLLEDLMGGDTPMLHNETWENLFPELYPKREEETVDFELYRILEGMNLERYSILFQGMDLKTFLQLTEDDLCHLGINLQIYREQFLENLHKIHCKKWGVNSIKIVQKSELYTIHDSINSLLNMKRQICVITSSFQYIKNNLTQCAKKDIHFDSTESAKYEEELEKTENTLKALKDEVNRLKKLVQKVDKKYAIGIPATFITPKKPLSRIRWVIPLSITLIIGFHIYRTTYIHRL